MEKISSSILALISEAAVLVKAGKISFANLSAIEILGQDCIGKKLRNVFGPELAGCQSSSFLAEVKLRGVPCSARVSKFDGEELIFITPSRKPDSILNEPFLCTMRNSLMSIELSANLLRSKAEELKSSEMLEKISILSKHYYRMTRLINNASFVLSDENSVDCLIAPVNISLLYGDILKSFDFFTEGAVIHADLGNDIVLGCNADLIKKLLLNLVSNCIAHGKGLSSINVNLINSPDSIILSVSDDGCGIDPDDLHMVFERYRYGFNISEMGRGAGLGLTVCRRIARMHGGTLLLESKSGRGTTVRVSLSKNISPVLSLHCPLKEPASFKDDILLELSDCLAPEFYSEKFMD